MGTNRFGNSQFTGWVEIAGAALSIVGSAGTFATADGKVVTFSASGDNILRASHASGNLLLQTGGANTRMTIASDGAVSIPGAVTVQNNLTLSSAGPILYWHESDGATDNKYWRMVPSGERFFFQVVNDALGTAGNVFYVDRTGTTVDSMTFGCAISIPGAVTISTTSGLVFSATGNNVIKASHASGALIFQTGGANTRMTIASDGTFTVAGSMVAEAGIYIQNISPFLYFKETDGGTDNKWWLMGASAERFYFNLRNDAVDTDTTIWYVDRTGMTVDAMVVQGALSSTVSLSARKYLTSQATAPTATKNATTLENGGTPGSAEAGVDAGSTDVAGSLYFDTGDGSPLAGKMMTLNFNSAYSSAPKSVTLTVNYDQSGYSGTALHSVMVANITTAGFDVYLGIAPQSEETYAYYYQVIA